MDVLSLLALAVAPGLAIAIFIYWKDKFDKEPLRLLIWCFVLGAFTIPPAIYIEELLMDNVANNYTGLMHAALKGFLVAAATEELLKYVVLRYYAYPKKDFNEPFDGITYSVMVSMGFATLENIAYVLGSAYGLMVALLRMFTAVPAHATFGILMGYCVGLAKFKPENATALHLAGIGSAILFHGFYDFGLMQGDYIILTLGAFASLLVGLWLSRQAIALHNQHSPFGNAGQGQGLGSV